MNERWEIRMLNDFDDYNKAISIFLGTMFLGLTAFVYIFLIKASNSDMPTVLILLLSSMLITGLIATIRMFIAGLFSI